MHSFYSTRKYETKLLSKITQVALQNDYTICVTKYKSHVGDYTSNKSVCNSFCSPFTEKYKLFITNRQFLSLCLRNKISFKVKLFKGFFSTVLKRHSFFLNMNIPQYEEKLFTAKHKGHYFDKYQKKKNIYIYILFGFFVLYSNIDFIQQKFSHKH